MDPTHRLSFTCRSQQSRSFPNLRNGLFPNSQKPSQPKQRIKPGTHREPSTHTQDEVPVGAPSCAPPLPPPPCAPQLPGQRPRPAPAPPPAGGRDRGPAPQRGVGGAAELFLVLTVLTPRGAVPNGSSGCRCGGAAASPAPVSAAAAAAPGAAVTERPRVMRLHDAGALSRPLVGAPAR